MAHPLETLRKYHRPLIILGILGSLGFVLSRFGTGNIPEAQATDTPSPAELFHRGEHDLSTPTSSPESSAVTIPSGDVIFPNSSVIYRRVPTPASIQGGGWECFAVPGEGNVLRAVMAAGDTNTRYDSTSAAVYINGVEKAPIIFDPGVTVENWPPTLSIVTPGIIACSELDS